MTDPLPPSPATVAIAPPPSGAVHAFGQRLLCIAPLAVQIALLVLVIDRYEIIGTAFRDLSLLVAGGFVVHALLSPGLRLNFFLALSVAGILFVLGPGNMAWLLGLGALLIGICHLPVAHAWRLCLIVFAAIALALVRTQTDGELATVVLPVLASALMFRLIIFWYDRYHAPTAGAWRWTTAYFLQLPNVCFPLYPLVDFKHFRSCHYNEDELRIYQRGVDWMYRGICHLLLYRFVYLHLTLDPTEVSGAADILRYSVTSFLLYLRVSGTFHLAIGILLLFGFNLPETHRRYYLASSFIDFWRRINIYWTDFMRRLVFFPLHFRLRRYGTRTAMLLSTTVVFACTWFLHSYQWFWLTGEWLLAAHDLLFWLTLGALFIVNLLVEERYGAAPTWEDLGVRSFNRTVSLSCRTLATFLSLACLWGMWSSDSFAQWLAMWQSSPLSCILVPAALAALYALSFILRRGDASGRAVRLQASARPVVRASRNGAMRAAALIGGVLVLGDPAVYGHLGDSAATLVESITTPQLNQRDARKLEKGYYERLLSVNVTSGLWEVYTREPQERLQDTPIWRETRNILMGELLPGSSLLFKGARLTVNDAGMRDRTYSLSKSAGTFRIAILGASHTMGSGVADEETFEAVLERRLNEARDPAGPRYELLNFAVAGYSALQYVHVLETKVLAYAPDYVMVVGHPQEDELLVRRLAQVLAAGNSLDYPDLEGYLRTAGVTSRTPPGVAERRLLPLGAELRQWAYERMAAACREAAASTVFVYLPMLGRTAPGRVRDALLADMRQVGFDVVDLSSVYDEHPPEELRLSAADNHPNARGHQVIAAALYDALHAIRGLH